MQKGAGSGAWEDIHRFIHGMMEYGNTRWFWRRWHLTIITIRWCGKAATADLLNLVEIGSFDSYKIDYAPFLFLNCPLYPFTAPREVRIEFWRGARAPVGAELFEIRKRSNKGRSDRTLQPRQQQMESREGRGHKKMPSSELPCYKKSLCRAFAKAEIVGNNQGTSRVCLPCIDYLA